MRALLSIALLLSFVSASFAQTPAPSASPPANAAATGSPRATLYLVSTPGQTVAVGIHPTIGACRLAVAHAADPGNRSVVLSTGTGWVASGRAKPLTGKRACGGVRNAWVNSPAGRVSNNVTCTREGKLWL